MALLPFIRARTCDELGVCQRTGAQCLNECQRAAERQGEQPIGYEAARTASVYHFPNFEEWRQRQSEAAHQPATEAAEPEWIYTAGKVAAWLMAGLGAAGLLGYLWTEHGHHVTRIYWAVAALYA